MNTKVNTQETISLTDWVTSFPVGGKPGAGGLEQPAGSGKVTLDINDLKHQLKELAPSAKVEIKTNTRQDVTVKIDERDRGYTITINPKKWRGAKKVAFLETWIFKTVTNGS